MALPSRPFVAAESIFAGLSVIAAKVRANLTAVTAATDTLTKTAHGFAVDDQLEYISGTGFTGLTANAYYYVVAVPTADTFQISATKGGTAISVGTSSAGVLAPVVIFEAKKVGSTAANEEKTLERPDSTGTLRVVRRVLTKQEESFTFETDEPKRLLKLFGGALSGLITATATLWIPDPQDASGKVALKSEKDFSCALTRDGDLTFGGQEFSSSTLKLTSNKQGAITWTADATA